MPPKIQLPNPFRTYAAHIYPRTIKDALTWGEYLWERNATYRNCIKKVVSYFASGISVRQDDTDDETDSEASAAFHDLVTDTYGMLPLVQRFGEELAAMGNVFVYVQRVCTRDLLCPTEGCGTVLRMRSLVRDRDYRWDPPSVGDDSGGWMRGVRMRCPRCGQDVRMTMRDSKSQDDRGRRLRIVFLPAADMRVRHNRLTDTYSYVYRMPQDVSDAIRRGEQIYLEDTPEVFLEAALRGEPYVILPQDALLAMRVPSLSGLDRVYGGWGLPMFMSAFDDIVRMQHMDKFNEAVMNDYLVPHRIISPAPQNLKAGIDDPNGFADQKTLAQLMTEIRSNLGNPFVLLLAHRNNDYPLYARCGVDVTLCGHGHGGIIRLPFTDGLLSVDRTLFPDHTAGLYQLDYGQLVVSRGLGNSGSTFRLFNRPHLPVVVLHS